MFWVLGNRLIKYKVDLDEPTGAPNAADTPAAAPPDTKSRLSVSDLKYSNICVSVYEVGLVRRKNHDMFMICFHKIGKRVT